MMKRLQQKCIIASTGLHLLLVFILLIGPGFLSSTSKDQGLTPISFILSKPIDDVLFRDGKLNATPPLAPAVARAEPKPETKPAVREIDPPKDREEAKPTKTDPASLELSKDSKPKFIPVVRNQGLRKTAQERAARVEEENRTRDAINARRSRAADLIAWTDRGIRSSESSSTAIDTNFSPRNDGSDPDTNYGQFVQSIYEEAWVTPEDAASDSAITKVTVTIANNGRVVKASIIKRCGDASVDNSVQRTLDRVNSIAPFPDGAKEKERTYIINFNLKTKRSMG
jgi:TonB family protein